jgi:hypothetical protein
MSITLLMILREKAKQNSSQFYICYVYFYRHRTGHNVRLGTSLI